MSSSGRMANSDSDSEYPLCYEIAKDAADRRGDV